MSEHELGKSFSERGRGGDRGIAERLVRRDRWVVRILTALAAGFWVLAAGVVLTLYWLLVVYVLPMMQHVAVDPKMDDRRAWEVLWFFALRIGWPMAIGGSILVALAALCTVVLVYRSRQATLRLVDQRLEQILAELRRLDRPPAE